MRALTAALLLVTLGHGTAGAYTLVVQEENGRPVRLRWRDSAMPLLLRLNDQTGPALPNIADGSDPLGAISRALDTWSARAALRFELGTSSAASGRRDGINLISFADTEENARQFEMAGDPVGLTLYFFEGESLTEADILFNPARTFTTTARTQSELRVAQAADLQAVTTHELGHAIGLNHSGVESASMWAFTSLAQRDLDADDRAGAQTLYPIPVDHGRILGTVRVDGQPAFGAQVVAVAGEGPVISALTLPDGTYRIESLPPGSYTVYVEPLDGPHGSAFVDPCVRFGNMGGAGIYDGADLTTDFPTSWFGGNEAPIEIALDPDTSALVNFDLARRTNTINPVRVGATEGGHLEEIPLAIPAGAQSSITIAGPGLDHGGALQISTGGGVSVVAPPGGVAFASCSSQPLPFVTFHAAVAADAAPGGRTIFVSAGGEIAAFTGALRVQAPPPSPAATATATPTVTPSGPVACVGDCNGDNIVTIDELIRGVNIALDHIAVSRCPGFDRDGSASVTIDELVQAVTAALYTCLPPLLG